MIMGAKMETNESRPKAVKYVCEQGEHSKFYLTETPTDSTVEQTKVESTNDNKPETFRHIARNTWKKKRTARSQSGTGIKQRKRIFRIFLKVLGSTANQKSNVLLLIFLTFSQFNTTYGQDLRASIETSPIIFGKDATFKCSIESSTSLASIGWLKGTTKENIIYSKTSTKEEKYTPEIYIEADRYIYLMIIHNVSLSDLDTYICEFGFYHATLSFTMEGNLLFIYVPGNNDIEYNISKTEMNVLIQRIYPQPYCTAFYNDEDITKSMRKVDIREATTYSTLMQMDLRECNGSLNISCILGSMSFNLTKRIQQCSDGVESSTPTGMELSTPKQKHTGVNITIPAIGITLIIVAVVAIVAVSVSFCKGSKTTEDLNVVVYTPVEIV
ncbi:uncharacterized protein LOC143055609 [Mytilus galloprovincialis]|uniref:uncharacterized protein LOC143055609 n=1 Tax=Mytilus galloprovincialis TaxID=29158 RepID=UPI003F7B7811